MVYVDVEIKKEVFEKLKEKLEENGKKNGYEDSYLFDGNLTKSDFDLHDVAFDSEDLMLSASFSVNGEELGNVAIHAMLEDIGWKTLLELRKAIDAKLGKIAETIENLL